MGRGERPRLRRALLLPVTIRPPPVLPCLPPVLSWLLFVCLFVSMHARTSRCSRTRYVRSVPVPTLLAPWSMMRGKQRHGLMMQRRRRRVSPWALQCTPGDEAKTAGGGMRSALPGRDVPDPSPPRGEEKKNSWRMQS
jgi:hypothetical protein